MCENRSCIAWTNNTPANSSDTCTRGRAASRLARPQRKHTCTRTRPLHKLCRPRRRGGVDKLVGNKKDRKARGGNPPATQGHHNSPHMRAPGSKSAQRQSPYTKNRGSKREKTRKTRSKMFLRSSLLHHKHTGPPQKKSSEGPQEDRERQRARYDPTSTGTGTCLFRTRKASFATPAQLDAMIFKVCEPDHSCCLPWTTSTTNSATTLARSCPGR